MLTPSIFREGFDDVMSYPFDGSRWDALMRTDVKDLGQSYELDIDMPGFQKEDIKADLNNGYLTIQAVVNRSNDEKDQQGHYIRRERYSGSCRRSFYVGEDITQEDIKAKFENGILKLEVPKKEEQAQAEERHFIAIEG